MLSISGVVDEEESIKVEPGLGIVLLATGAGCPASVDPRKAFSKQNGREKAPRLRSEINNLFGGPSEPYRNADRSLGQ